MSTYFYLVRINILFFLKHFLLFRGSFELYQRIPRPGRLHPLHLTLGIVEGLRYGNYLLLEMQYAVLQSCDGGGVAQRVGSERGCDGPIRVVIALLRPQERSQIRLDALQLRDAAHQSLASGAVLGLEALIAYHHQRNGSVPSNANTSSKNRYIKRKTSQEKRKQSQGCQSGHEARHQVL